MSRPKKQIHISVARNILLSKAVCDLKVWRTGSPVGETINYNDVIYIGGHVRGGTFRVKSTISGEIRLFNEVMLYEINGMEVRL